MAESGRDSNVEDVLTSVRRLVSNEVPRNNRPELPKAPEALVLTDSHRIASNEPALKSEKSLEDRIAELEAAVSARADEWEPDGSEDQAEHRPTRIVYTRPPSAEESDEMRRNSARLSQIGLVETEEPAVEEVSIEKSQAPEFRRDLEDDAAPMVEDVPTEPRPKAEVAAFGNPDDVVANIEKRWDAGGEPAAEVAHVSAMPDQEPEPEPVTEAVEPKAQAPLVLSEPAIPTPEKEPEEPAALEVEAEESDGWEEEYDPTDDVIQLPIDDLPAAPVEEIAADEQVEATSVEELPEIEAPAAEDEVEARVGLEEEAETPEPVADEPTEEPVDQIPSPEDEFHEESEAQDEDESLERELAAQAIGQAVGDMLGGDHLRPVVAQMIRQELQGELGERITRNVRKLVRREIKRALQAQELE